MSKKAKVTAAIADRHSQSKIVEFTFPDGKGGLIEFRAGENGEHTVFVYRLDAGVTIVAG